MRPHNPTEPDMCLSGNKSMCEFFAGIGLVHEALRRQGWQCTYANDIDPKKHAMYLGNYGPSPHYHECDIWDTDAVVDRIENQPFLATASFPCTDMSLAGSMKGFQGSQSSAFFGFTKVLESLGRRKPRVVLLENVTGFLHSHGGKDFESATHALADLGYWLDCFVIDARYFVPQSRPRLFLLGYHDTIQSPLIIRKPAEEQFVQNPWRQAIEESLAIRPARVVSLMDSMDLCTGWAAVNSGSPARASYDLTDYIDKDRGQQWWSSSEVDRHFDMMFDRHRRQLDLFSAQRNKTSVFTAFRRVRDGKQRAEVRFDGIAGCLRTPKGGSAKQIVIVIQNGSLKMRWMSPREYARLQGIADFTLPDNVIQGLYGFGDAVCVPVIHWIDENILTPVYESATFSHQVKRHHGRPVLA